MLVAFAVMGLGSALFKSVNDTEVMIMPLRSGPPWPPAFRRRSVI